MKILTIAHNKIGHSQGSFTSSLYSNLKYLAHDELKSNENMDEHQNRAHNQIWRISNEENEINKLKD